MTESYGQVRTAGQGMFQLPNDIIEDLGLKAGDRLMLIDANPPKIWLGEYLLVPCGGTNHKDIIDLIEIREDRMIQLSEVAYRRIGLFSGKVVAIFKTIEGFILLDLWMDALGNSIRGRVPYYFQDTKQVES